MDFAIFQQLGVGLALGSLIGLERENKQIVPDGSFAGIRTFGLIGLLGALAYVLAEFSVFIFPVITTGFLALMVAAYVFTTRKYEQLGMTSEIAGVVVYLVGVLAAMQLYVVAVSVALALLTMLHFKKPLHSLAKHINNEELVSTIQFMIVAFIILPLLPNENFGPYDFFNPYIAWLMVVFISSISFISYVAIKIFGAKRGISFAGFLAGFISSTALAFSFSAQSKKTKNIVNPYVFGLIIASTAMFFRVLLEVSILNPDLVVHLLRPILAMGFTGIFISIFYWLKKDRTIKSIKEDVLDLESPFQLKPALKFAALFVLILFLSKVANAFTGHQGLYLTSFISGLLDVDAITISIAALAENSEISNTVAVVAITIAAITNTLVKGAIFIFFGAKKVAYKILSALFIIAGVGIISLAIL